LFLSAKKRKRAGMRASTARFRRPVRRNKQSLSVFVMVRDARQKNALLAKYLEAGGSRAINPLFYRAKLLAVFGNFFRFYFSPKTPFFHRPIASGCLAGSLAWLTSHDETKKIA